MKLIQISVDGLPLFRTTLKIDFFATQRVSVDESDSLFSISPNLYVNCVNAFVGINASGKTSVLNTILFVIHLLQNEPINHISTRFILGDSKEVIFNIIFSTGAGEICLLETHIISKKDNLGNISYSISSETLKKKNISKSVNKKQVLEFSNIKPSLDRNSNISEQTFLPDDISIIIAHNKTSKDIIDVIEMLFLTDFNTMPYAQIQFPSEIIEFLDPSIDKINVTGDNPDKDSFHIVFKNKKEIIVQKQADLTKYLSSGTIKGITMFMSIIYVLMHGAYLIVDELENHFNKEIVATIIRFFMDPKTNPKGAVLIYSTHYPELLDVHKRNDSIYITNNPDGIIINNLSKSLKRNDIKKSDAFQSGYLDGTAPSYNSYINLKNYIKMIVGDSSAKTL